MHCVCQIDVLVDRAAHAEAQREMQGSTIQGAVRGLPQQNMLVCRCARAVRCGALGKVGPSEPSLEWWLFEEVLEMGSPRVLQCVHSKCVA